MEGTCRQRPYFFLSSQLFAFVSSELLFPCEIIPIRHGGISDICYEDFPGKRIKIIENEHADTDFEY